MTLSGRSATITVVALVLSVCLNVFVAGLIAGRVTGVDRSANSQPSGGLERFIATVPEDGRPVMRQAFRDNRRRLQELYLAVRDARDDAAAIVGAESFDHEAFEAAMAIVRTRTKALETEVHGVIGEALGRLPAELRAKMADRWRDRQ